MASYISSYISIFLLIYVFVEVYSSIYVYELGLDIIVHSSTQAPTCRFKHVAYSDHTSVVGRWTAHSERAVTAESIWRDDMRALLHCSRYGMRSRSLYPPILSRLSFGETSRLYSTLISVEHRFFSAVFPDTLSHIKVCFDFDNKWLEVYLRIFTWNQASDAKEKNPLDFDLNSFVFYVKL